MGAGGPLGGATVGGYGDGGAGMLLVMLVHTDFGT